ncbi:hypothetical protein ABGV42_00800 [Paenibacillus pabuli]|uniref:hypothetical protein n=1 Tax=Paenibacillus pabuli TaxID=1472 RepID=UPI003241C38B
MSKDTWKINLSVCEKIMGWRWIEGTHYDVDSNEQSMWLLPSSMGISDVGPGEWTFYDLDLPVNQQYSKLTIFAVPGYADVMGRAWEVINWAVSKGTYFMDSFVQNLMTMTETETYGADRDYQAIAELFSKMTPLAICKAALKTLEEN